jgi:hypothetical protein
MIVRILIGLLTVAAACFGQVWDTAGNAKPGGAASVSDVDQSTGLADLLPSQLKGGNRDFQSLPSTFFALDIGQGMKGVWDHPTDNPMIPYTTMNRVWQEKMRIYLSEMLVYKDRLSLTVSIECDLDFSMIQRSEAFLSQTQVPVFTFFPNDIELRYKWGNLDKPWLQIAAGYFPYKYNPDAKNLGEFLLRCSAYPNTIVTNFEFPLTRELGLLASASTEGFLDPAIDKGVLDVMLTSETHDWPVQDATISCVASNTALNFLTLGGGVSWQRLFPVDEAITRPEKNTNVFYEANGDTNYYTFQSTKLAGFASVNPQRFIPEFKIPPAFIFGDIPFFGKEDFKVYGEVAVLGLDNYVAYDSIPDSSGTMHWQARPDSINYYNKVSDRMPVMVGVNLPTHPLLCYGVLPFILTKWLYDETGSDVRPLAWITLVPALASGIAQHYLGWNMSLDVFSLEFEWFSQRYTNSNRRAINPQDKIPIPYQNEDRNLAGFGKPEPVKYSLYFKKSFLNKRFAVSGLVGRDHMRPIVFATPSINQTDDFLQTKAHWWWTIRLSANF